ncbi:aldose epimerase [Paenibacillus filicis]|uniref:Aldose epimerase n=1 Tax=Paenibacillus gyeongsangnamensis TaxID=3388067 RepID=A0ABT4QGZ3_9BACL|nr:aldose epimerase [Paenibacillus filicis]MCZ8516006.1 aldose epimerase [Paenibacillus filicis]
MKATSLRKYTDGYDIYELNEPSTGSSFRLAPERGGILIGFASRGEEHLYLDKKTFLDPKANIRGGNPILFPISGQLAGGEYEWNGVRYPMANHGIARNRPWQVVKADDDGICLSLSSDEETRRSFPFDFELRFTYTLNRGILKIEQSYANRSSASMPMYAGSHPYFAANRKNLVYETDADRYYDYNDRLEKKYDGNPLDLGSLVESVVFLGAEKREITFSPLEGKRIRLTYGDEFKYVVLWSVAGQDFVCVEPWMARTDELNRKQELVYVPPGEALQTGLTIEAF